MGKSRWLFRWKYGSKLCDPVFIQTRCQSGAIRSQGLTGVDSWLQKVVNQGATLSLRRVKKEPERRQQAAEKEPQPPAAATQWPPPRQKRWLLNPLVIGGRVRKCWWFGGVVVASRLGKKN